MDVERIWQRIAEPLLEDEALRGDLDDQAFQTLIDWAMAAAERCADMALGAEDPAAFAAECSHRLRAILSAASFAAANGETGEVVAALAPPVYAVEELPSLGARLAAIQLGCDPIDNAQLLVQALSDVGVKG